MDNEKADGYWEQDEFEELVARSLIAAFESDLRVIGKADWQKGKYVLAKPYFAPNAHDLGALRNIGPYFPPDNRILLERTFWHHLDGLPETASFAINGDFRQDDGDTATGYLEIYVARRHRGVLPHGCRLPPGRNVAIYRLCGFYPQRKGGIEAAAEFFGIRENGDVVAEIGRHIGMHYGAATLQCFTDKRFLWNVRATEHSAHATFGIYESQLKSLFYARELPLTATGRKRPILHWVKAHQRRLQNGDDIDIEKFLRGITEFEYHGTRFEIINPQKAEKKAA